MRLSPSRVTVSLRAIVVSDMGWLRLVGSLKLMVSFAKEPYKRDDILQKRSDLHMSDDSNSRCDLSHICRIQDHKQRRTWLSHICSQISLSHLLSHMGWLRLVGSLKFYVSFAEYRLFYRAFLQKRPTIFRSLLIVATPYLICLTTISRLLKIVGLFCKRAL